MVDVPASDAELDPLRREWDGKGKGNPRAALGV